MRTERYENRALSSPPFAIRYVCHIVIQRNRKNIRGNGPLRDERFGCLIKNVLIVVLGKILKLIILTLRRSLLIGFGHIVISEEKKNWQNVKFFVRNIIKKNLFLNYLRPTTVVGVCIS